MFTFSKQLVVRILLFGLIILSTAGYSRECYAGCGTNGCDTAEEAEDTEEIMLAVLQPNLLCPLYITSAFLGMPAFLHCDRSSVVRTGGLPCRGGTTTFMSGLSSAVS